MRLGRFCAEQGAKLARESGLLPQRSHDVDEDLTPDPAHHFAHPTLLSSGTGASTSAKARVRSDGLIIVVPPVFQGGSPSADGCPQREACRAARADGDAKLVLAGRDRRRRGPK